MDNVEFDLAKLKALEWSKVRFSLSKLLDKYRLPQIVKIVEGFYGEGNDSTLCKGTILCLQSVTTVQKVHGRLSWGKGRKISIPLDCRSKVEVRSSNLKDVYESVEELCSVFPKHVRVLEAYHSKLSNEVVLNVGDKLQLKGNNKGKKIKEMLVCINQNGQEIELPKDCVAGFQPLVDGKEYYLSDALKKFKMPLNVQFVELESIGKDARSDDRPPCQPFRTICLDSISKEKIIEATTILDGQLVIKQISSDVEIELIICEDSFQHSADYAKVCQILNPGTKSKDGSKQLHESVDNDDSIQNTTPSMHTQPFAKPCPIKPKPVVPPKPKTRISNVTRVEQDPIYEEIGFNERKYNESHLANKDSTYTALDPTYISNRKYERPSFNHHTESSINHLEKSHFSKNQIASPVTLPHLSQVGDCKPLITGRSEVSNTKPDRAPKKAKGVSASPDMQAQNPYSIPECPTNIPDVHPSPAHGKEEIQQAIAMYPSDLSSLNVGDVGKLLNYLGMEKHVQVFADELIDGSMLASMDGESLQSLEVDPFHVTKLLKFIDGWRPRV